MTASLHVVAVRLGRLGDIVMALPALDWLSCNEQLRTTWIVDEPYRSFFGPRLPGLDAVEPAGVEEIEPADLVLDLHGVPASRRLCRRIPSRVRAPRVSTRKESLRRRSLVLASWGPVRLGAHRLRTLPRLTWPERHLGAVAEGLARLGLTESDWPERPAPRPSLACSPVARPGAVTNTLPVLGLSPGAHWRTKRWPIHHWRSLAVRWMELTGGSVWLFGSEDEQQLLRSVASDGVARPWADSSLDGLEQGLLACDVFVCGDSGPLHLAGGLGVPVVALFGPTPPEAGFWVWGDRGRLAHVPSLDCAPCSLHGQDRCPTGHHRCMQDLAPDAVAHAAIQLIADRSPLSADPVQGRLPA